MSKVKLLMIALEFPPVNSTGCYRYLKFLKNLEKFDIDPTVITLPLNELKLIHPNSKVDYELIEAIPKSVRIIEVPLFKKITSISNKVTFKSKLKHYFNYKGETLAKAWEINLSVVIDSLVSKSEIDVVFVSIPPFSLGLLVAKIFEHYDIPFIIDFRDELSLNKGVPFPTFFHYHFALNSEKTMFRKATKITSVTPQLINIFKNIHKEIDQNKFQLITNGFDFENVNMEIFENESINETNKYIIGYSGSYYYDPKSNELANIPFYRREGIKKITYRQKNTKEDWSYRSPLYFLRTLTELFKLKPELKDKVEFHHIGHVPNWLNEMILNFGLQDNFVNHGFVNKSENLKIQNKFNALLCTSEKVIDGEHYCLSSKVFDYIQAKKPILAFVTEGSMKNFAKNSGCAVVFDPDEIEESAKTLGKVISSNIKFSPNKDYLSKYKSSSLTLDLSKIILDCMPKY